MDNFNEETNQKRFVAGEQDYKFIIDGKTENVAERIEQRKNEEIANAMKKYMPIGSIVKIKESFKNYMIIGFNHEMKEELYDYISCEYPYGVDGEHGTFVFNHNQIDKVLHIGFVNNQEKSFKAELIGDKNEAEEVER